MKASTALMVVALVALAGISIAQRQDEALDSLMLSSNLQPVNDPIPRLLQEALESATAAPGSYGGKAPAADTTPAPAPEAPAPKPAPKPSGSSNAVAGAASIAAAAAVAALLL